MYEYEKKEKQVILKIEISKEDWEKAVEHAYEENKGKFNIQGFRKGKAPRKVIEQNYGDTIFFDDALDHAVSDEYSKFLSEHTDIIPVEQPHVEDNKFTADQGLSVTLKFDVMPEFKLPELSGLKAKKVEPKVTDEQVEAEIESERQAHARYIEEDKVADNGDFATIDFTGYVDDVKFEGGEAKDYRLELGSHTFIEGFEDQVVGMKKGEEKDVKVTFPENYHAENLKGKPAVFKVKLNKVEKKELPTIDDKYISDTTEFETLEEYKKAIKENLLKMADERAERDYEVALLDEIAEKSNIELPQSMVDHEVNHIVEDFEHRLSHQGMNLQNYLDYVGKTLDQFKKEREEDAAKNIKTRLVLQKLIAENNLTVSAEELDKSIEEYASRYQMSGEEFKKAMSPDDYAYFENSAIMTKVLDFIKSKNK